MTDPHHERVQRAARDLIIKMAADAAAEDSAEAMGWTIVCRDLVDDSVRIYGLFTPEQLPDAIVWAEQFKTDVNRGVGPDELGWSVDVHPVLPIE